MVCLDNDLDTLQMSIFTNHLVRRSVFVHRQLRYVQTLGEQFVQSSFDSNLFEAWRIMTMFTTVQDNSLQHLVLMWPYNRRAIRR